MGDWVKCNWHFVCYAFWWNSSKVVARTTYHLPIWMMGNAADHFEKFYEIVKRHTDVDISLDNLADEWAWFRKQYNV